MAGSIGRYFDANGNMTELEHLAGIEWNYRDNISKAVTVERPGNSDDCEYYVYDSGGNRVRKVTEANGERIDKLYLGGVEMKRIYAGRSLIVERSDVHIMDDSSRIAIVNYWERDDRLREVEEISWIGRNRIRYQYGNHLGSASPELDDGGQIISYEEFFAYGGTSFTSGRSQKEVKLKQYRYTGKERDEFTGLYYYYGARYYDAEIGMWTSTDPAKQYHSAYTYSGNNPIGVIDPDGTTGIPVNGQEIYMQYKAAAEKLWFQIPKLYAMAAKQLNDVFNVTTTVGMFSKGSKAGQVFFKDGAEQFSSNAMGVRGLQLEGLYSLISTCLQNTIQFD